MTTALCSVNDVKLYLSIPSDDTTDDTLLGSMVDAVNEFIEAETDRIFADPGSDTTKYFDKSSIDQSGLLWLGDDLLSLTSITNGNGDSIATNKVQLWPLNSTPTYVIKLLASSELYWQFDYNDSVIGITGRWAYSSTVPKQVKQAAIRLAAWVYKQKDNFQETDRPIMTADGMVIMPNKFPKDIDTWLKSMKRVVL